MTIFRSRCVALIALTALASCNRQDDRICLPPEKIPIGEIARAKGAMEWRKITENCVHAWAYRLAHAPGSNTEIARAVVVGCSDGIAFWVSSRSVGPDSEVPLYGSMEALEKSANDEMLQLALFRVTQARAGKCEIPGPTEDLSEIDNAVNNAVKK